MRCRFRAHLAAALSHLEELSHEALAMHFPAAGGEEGAGALRVEYLDAVRDRDDFRKLVAEVEVMAWQKPSQ
jgi:hypothetical protein